MYSDDLAQLEAGMTLYDAFYRWCRDATDETHTGHSKKPHHPTAVESREITSGGKAYRASIERKST